jgi:hypothetical protein
LRRHFTGKMPFMQNALKIDGPAATYFGPMAPAAL